MKRFLLFLLMIFVWSKFLFAETQMILAAGGVEVANIFALEFYTDPNVLYTTSIAFTNMDPTSSHVMADGKWPNDGKNDTGLVCKSNLGVVWYFKIDGNAQAPFSLSKIKYYFGTPWHRTLNRPSNGTLAQSPAWYNIPSSPTIIYTAGTDDLTNTPYGTLCLFSFAINPGGLDATQVYRCTINYTLTATM